ncbi:MAG: DUF3791 domain-containing protein [Bacteroides sp.]|nr:DUF3791 domain-containing protein [Bacteroides sp.]
MDAVGIIKQLKYARIINAFAEQAGIPLSQAMDMFYHSITFQLLQEGIADLHCRSDLYLVDELKREFQ